MPAQIRHELPPRQTKRKCSHHDGRMSAGAELRLRRQSSSTVMIWKLKWNVCRRLNCRMQSTSVKIQTQNKDSKLNKTEKSQRKLFLVDFGNLIRFWILIFCCLSDAVSLTVYKKVLIQNKKHIMMMAAHLCVAGNVKHVRRLGSWSQKYY